MTDLYYEVHGNGFPIVMIHSPGVDSREWRSFVPALAEKYQVITYDCRGMGRSPAPHSPTNLVQDLKELFDHLNLQKAALVGHSMGGQLATEFSLAYPSLIDALVLLAPSLTGFAHSKEFTDWMALINAHAPDIHEMVQLSAGGMNYRVTMESTHRDFFLEMHRQYMTKMLTKWKSFEVVWPQPHAIDRLDQLASDTLFIQGTIEWPDMRRIAEHFKRVPSIQFAEIEDADHMLTLTHAETLAQHILKFIKEKTDHAAHSGRK